MTNANVEALRTEAEAVEKNVHIEFTLDGEEAKLFLDEFYLRAADVDYLGGTLTEDGMARRMVERTIREWHESPSTFLYRLVHDLRFTNAADPYVDRDGMVELWQSIADLAQRKVAELAPPPPSASKPRLAVDNEKAKAKASRAKPGRYE